jgi:predicted NUDIX family NTP pyrophosphohydrolase
MPKQSAGILLYRLKNDQWQVFLIHMGGPFWIKKDEGAWSIPKGEFTSEEDPLAAAKREFLEETGFKIEGNFIEVKPVKQPGGKLIYAWAIEGDCDASAISSNTFEIEWPPGSGKKKTFPEADRAEWFSFETAKSKILKGQQGLIDEVEQIVNYR